MARIEAIHPSQTTAAHQAEAVSFERLNALQKTLQPRLEKLSSDNGTSPTRLRALPQPAARIFDEIAEATGQVSVTRRLAALLHRVAEATDNHVWEKFGAQRANRASGHKKADELKESKQWQSVYQAASGFGGALVALAAAIFPSLKGLENVTHLTRPAAEALVKWSEGHDIPLQHQQSLINSEHQELTKAIEKMEGLPKQLQQLVMQLVRLDLEAHRGIGR